MIPTLLPGNKSNFKSTPAVPSGAISSAPSCNWVTANWPSVWPTAPSLQWFCGLSQMDKVTVPGKSTLQRYETWLADEQMRPLIEQLLCQGRDQALGRAVVQ